MIDTSVDERVIYEQRELAVVSFLGTTIRFVATNDRLRDRVEKLSNEEELLRELAAAIEPDDTVWDVGACLGIHTLIAGANARDGRVIAVEPMPTNRGVLAENLNCNQFDHAWIERRALSERVGESTFQVRQSMSAGHGRHGLEAGEYESVRDIAVKTTTGDTLAAEQGVPNVIKIDVEGAEGCVLDGLEETLRDDRLRDVFIETHAPNPVQPSYEDFGYSRRDLLEMLIDAGFELETVGGSEYHIHATV